MQMGLLLTTLRSLSLPRPYRERITGGYVTRLLSLKFRLTAKHHISLGRTVEVLLRSLHRLSIQRDDYSPVPLFEPFQKHI
mgnify:CR=1 FL=1